MERAPISAGISSPVAAPKTHYSMLTHLGIAVASVTLVSLLKYILHPWFGNRGRFILFLPAVMLAAWYGGGFSAVLTLILSAIVAVYFYVPTHHTVIAPNGLDIQDIVLYLLSGLIIASVNEMQRQAQHRAEIARETAQQARALLEERNAQIEALNHELQRSVNETYHRVKNNLQAVASLIGIQLVRKEDFIPASELRRIEQHLRALAAINDLLTLATRRSGEVTELSADATLEKLLELVPATLGNRHIEFQVDKVPFSIKQSTSLALLTNELISNAIKHGKGDISLSLAASDNQACLEVCDDGPGFPEGFRPETAAKTGLDLIENLSRWDLQGEIRYENRKEGGARIRVTFPLQTDADAA